MSMFPTLPASLNLTGYNSLRAAVREGTVTPAQALEAVEAIAKARNGKVSGKLERVLSELRAGKWQKAEPKPKAEAKAKAPAKAQTGEPRMFADLSGLERHRALRAEAKRLGLATGGKAAEVEARILDEQPELLLHLQSHEEAQKWRAAPAKAKTPAKAKRRTAKVAKAGKPAMPSVERLRDAHAALGAWLANQ